MIRYSTFKIHNRLASVLDLYPNSLLPNLYAITFFFSTCLASQVFASSCKDHEYGTGEENCYPAWYGKSASGAFYTIVVPNNWDPKTGLVIWNHGFEGFLKNFESKDLLSILDPTWEGFYTGKVKERPSLGPFADFILARGFAMAASSYSQTGWALFDSHTSNGELYNQFLSIISELNKTKPEKFYIIGGSMGGLVSLRDLESQSVPNPDGALLLCGANGGSVNWLDAFDLRVIYESVCSSVPGAQLPQPWYRRPDLLFGEIDYLDSLNKCVGLATRLLIDENNPLEVFAWEKLNQKKAERLEFILNKTKTVNSYFLALNLWYSVFQLPRLINEPTKLNGINPISNVGVDYGDPTINRAATRVASLPSSKKLLSSNFTPTGNIKNTKIISIHTSHDGLVKVENQESLRNLIPASQLTVAVVDDSKKPSHCGFSTNEGLAAWKELTDWVAGSKQPSASDLQSTCLSAASTVDVCNYSPEFSIETSIPTFSRKNLIGVTGVNVFDNSSGILNFESLQSFGSDQNFRGSLKLMSREEFKFAISEIQATDIANRWQHSGKYDPDLNILYIPKVSIKNLSPPNFNEYDLFFSVNREDDNEVIKLLEIDPQ